MNASAIYWALNCDIDISMEELDALNPTLEQYRKTLQRLADNHRREKFANPAFLSLLNVLFSFRKILTYTNLEDELNTFSNLLYELLADFIPNTVKEDRLKWAFRASNVLLCEKQCIFPSRSNFRDFAVLFWITNLSCQTRINARYFFS